MKHSKADFEASISPTSGGDPVQCLDELRASLESFRTPGDLTALLQALSSSLDDVMAEHKGMADELLSLYEQLGIVFEVTRKLAGVQSESEVLGLFLDSLRRSFDGRVVLAAQLRRSGGWALDVTAGGSASLIADHSIPIADVRTPNPWLSDLLHRACECREVIVEPVPSGAMPDAIAEVMIGPVVSGDALVCSIVLLRTHQTPGFRASEMKLINSLSTFCGDLIRSHRLVGELRGMSIAMVRALVNAVDQKDQYTCGHSLRVAYYATSLGQRLGLGEIDLQMLQWAALLHDVGKIGIRDNVLKKEGKLTPEEFGHIKEHPVRSHQVVQEVPQLLNALDGILHHHERYDGSGYPAGLKGEQIPLQARIIQIADVFDALTSNRSYRAAFDWQRALDILREEAGKTVDPQLQKMFDSLIRETLEEGVNDPGGSPQAAWERMVDRANHFMQDMNAPILEPDGE